MSQAGRFFDGAIPPGGAVQTLTGDIGGAVGPDGANNIDLLGGNNLTVTGNPGTNTLTFDVDGTLADTYTTDAGNAIPAAGVLNVLGGLLINTTAAGNTITINLDNALDGQIPIAATAGNVAYANITSADASVTITNGANSIDLSVGASGVLTLTSDAGGAVSPDGAGTINVLGGNNITGTGNPGTNTITFDLDGNVADTFNADAGSALPVLGIIGFAGGTLINTSAAGSTVTINLDNALDGQIPIAATAGNVAYANIASADASITITNGANSIDLSVAGGAAADTFNADVGSAAPAAGVITMAGGSNLTTSGAGSTVTYNLDNTVSISGSMTAGTGLIATTGGVNATGNSVLNGGTVNIGTDNAGNAITIGTGTVGRLINIGLSAAAHTITIGNTNTTTSISMQSGTGNTVSNSSGTNTLTGTGGVSINSLSGAINVGSDANANAINIGTGAASRTITIGNTTGATAVNIDIGTGDYTLDSATGNIITALDTGEVTKPLQPAFLANLSVTASNVTGAGTNYTLIADTEIFDQNADYNNATGIFTAPVTGRYEFTVGVVINDLTAAMTASLLQLATSNRNYSFGIMNVGAARAIDGANRIALANGFLTDMDAGDTAQVIIVVFNGAGDTADVAGGSKFAGFLAC